MADPKKPDKQAVQLKKIEWLLNAARSTLAKKAPKQLLEIEGFVAELKRAPTGKPVSLKAQKAIRTLFFAQLDEKVASYTRSLDSLVAPVAAGNPKALKMQKAYKLHLKALLETKKKLSTASPSAAPKTPSGQMPTWVAQQLNKKLPK